MTDNYSHMKTGCGEIVIYKSEDGLASFEVQLREDTVWLTLNQMAELFDRDKSVVSRHLKTIYTSGELERKATVAKYATVQKEGKRKVTRQIERFNLDVIISVGYRVNSKRGVRFRQWATDVLKQYLIKGYSTNEKRLAEKGLSELEETFQLLSRTLISHNLVSDEGKGLLDVISRYAKSWSLLLQYDEDRLELPTKQHQSKNLLDYKQAKGAISVLKKELIAQSEASDLFGKEREQYLKGVLGNIYQTFEGVELYPNVEEKAAHLLYFVIKDHPFSDGNKRIGSFLFLLFLNDNELLDQSGINDNALVALALLIAESDPLQKDLMIKLILNFLNPVY